MDYLKSLICIKCATHAALYTLGVATNGMQMVNNLIPLDIIKSPLINIFLWVFLTGVLNEFLVKFLDLKI